VLAYGSVLAGWAVEYGWVMWRGSLTGASLDQVVDHFSLLQGDYQQMAYWHTWIMAIVAAIAALPIHRGFGQIMRVLLPVMLLMLVAGNIAAYNLGDYESAMLRLFEMRPLELTRHGVLQALSQALYTLGIGLGVWMVYGSYAPNDRSTSWNSAWVVFIDGITSIFAALLVYGYLETQSIDPAGGVALMFVSLPYAMGQMPFSDVIGSLFYALVVLAAVTTCIALMEPGTRHLSHRWRFPRPAAALVVGLIAWGLGLLCIYSLDPSRGLSYGDRSAFVWLDLLSANMLLPLCIMMIAAFVSWRLERQQLLSAFKSNGRGLFWLWSGVLRYIAPVAAFVVLIFGLLQRL
jgi:NSS family neurotransmitter:Na+ symporter